MVPSSRLQGTASRPVGKRLMPSLPEQCPAWLCLSSLICAALEGRGEGQPLSLL